MGGEKRRAIFSWQSPIAQLASGGFWRSWNILIFWQLLSFVFSPVSVSGSFVLLHFIDPQCCSHLCSWRLDECVGVFWQRWRYNSVDINNMPLLAPVSKTSSLSILRIAGNWLELWRRTLSAVLQATKISIFNVAGKQKVTRDPTAGDLAQSSPLVMQTLQQRSAAIVSHSSIGCLSLSAAGNKFWLEPRICVYVLAFD